MYHFKSPFAETRVVGLKLTTLFLFGLFGLMLAVPEYATTSGHLAIGLSLESSAEEDKDGRVVVRNYPGETDASTQPQRGEIRGRVIDMQSGEPVAYTSILLVEIGRSATVHEDGTFSITNIAPGEYTLRTHRVGYQSFSRRITIQADTRTEVDIELRSSVFRSRSIEVWAPRENGDNLITPELRVDGRELRQQLGRTLAETLQNEPGMAQSTMGPAPARPVLRGLSGDRLVVLEDGRTTGDVSSTAPDHAIAIDPINSQYIEILRGPSALVYTSNAVAGVINVVRGQIPTEIPDHFHGSASLQGESVNTGLSAGISTYGSTGSLALKGDFGLRTAADIQTPEGSLDNTAIRNLHGGLGVSRVRDRSLLGFSANAYVSAYGVPGDFIGSHPNGVKMNLQRYQADARYEQFPAADWLRRVRYDYTFSFYFHEELEYSPARERHDIVGYEANVISNTFNARFYHNHLGRADQGIFGAFAQHRYYSPGGFTFTPTANEASVAAYTYQEFSYGRWSWQTGLRTDLHSAAPTVRIQTDAGDIRTRTFFNVSAGLHTAYQLATGLRTHLSLMRTNRMPGIEELFAAGPHLPSYSFEVGNADLNAEVGHGIEWGIRYATDRIGIRNAWFYYDYSNYLYPRNTGEESVRRPLPIYQFTGEAARLWGTEVLAEVYLTDALVVNATASYVIGDLTSRDEPLPFIPPLTGKADVQYGFRNFTLGTSLRFALDQNRLGEFEEPTDGYQVFDVFLQGHMNVGHQLHTISLTLENLTNTTYRMHLSRVKSIMPEPGRNLKLLYRVYF